MHKIISGEVDQCAGYSSVNEFPHVLASPGFWVATDIDADRPCAGSTANDLSNLAYHFVSEDGNAAPHPRSKALTLGTSPAQSPP